MPVKHWSFAGLLLTTRCDAACASCYLCCSPADGEELSVEEALETWRQLQNASPHGCRIHLTGGEPFLDWPRLIELCRRARDEGLGPLEKIETNALWARNPAVARDRLAALGEAGLGKLTISADPYHQQFVPIERCRMLADLAEEALGRRRVQVRWRDWLADGCDTSELPADRRSELFARYAASGRDRLCGRAAHALAPMLPPKPLTDLADSPCRERLLRSRHVHVGPGGWVTPGTCAGIALGRIGLPGRKGPAIGEVWQGLYDAPRARPVLATLADGGPVALAARAVRSGFAPREGYASKCHLCWHVRSWLAERGMHRKELQPARMYGPAETLTARANPPAPSAG